MTRPHVPEPVFRRHSRVWALAVFAAWGIALCVRPLPVCAQRDVFQGTRFAESVFLDTDSVAARKLGAARDLLGARQWTDAIELVRQIAEQHGERLVAIETGRYVTVQEYCDILLSAMPAAGLKSLREQIDPQARRWFDAARVARDENGLARVVRKAFLSSFGDDAAFLLGDIAWERGAVAKARAYWLMLLPAPAAPPDTPAAKELSYPDTDVSRAEVECRLILCDLAQGKTRQAEQRLSEFSQQFPEATGRLAGKSGVLSEIVRGVFSQIGTADVPRTSRDVSTFAGNYHRNHVVAKALDVGAEQWSIPLRDATRERARPADDFERLLSAPAAGMAPDAPLWFPVVRGDVVFYCDETAVYAYALRSTDGTGRPAWGDAPEQAAIYRLPAEKLRRIGSYRARVGLPQYTVTIDGDYLYARLGSPIAGQTTQRALRPTSSFLVRLDLEREGDLAWPLIDAEQIEPEGTWAFEGAPIVSEGRVYVALQCRTPQPQCNVACFDAETAQLLWNRKVCVGLDLLGGDVDEVQHQLLTLAEDRVYHVTNLGAIAALDAGDGTPRWVATYPHLEPETLTISNRRLRCGPNPCVYHDGVLFVAPTDSDRVLAIEAHSGVVKWEQELPGVGRALLGVHSGRLIVSGQSLFALNAETGTLDWRVGATDSRGNADPEAAASGRGVIAGGLVYWPRREDLLIVDVESGRRRRVVNLLEQHGVQGGNLTATDNFLLIAQPDRLSVFSEFGGIPKGTRPRVAGLMR